MLNNFSIFISLTSLFQSIFEGVNMINKDDNLSYYFIINFDKFKKLKY